LVTYTKEVTRCGFDSITYGQSTPVWQRTKEITPRECRRAVKKGLITVDTRTFRVTVGDKFETSFYSRGGVADDGTCQVEDFRSGGVQFYNSYEQTRISVLVAAIRGMADTEAGTVIFNNGVQGRWKDEVLRDAIEGTMVWEAADPACEETVSEIFLGSASIHRRLGSRNVEEAVVMVAGGPTGDQYAGLVLHKPTSLCGAHCYTTQVKGVEVCILREGDAPLPPHTFRASFSQTKTGIQTEIGHLHLGTNMRMHKRFELVQTELCQLERKILHGRLQALAGADNPYALLDLFGPGHDVIVAGAVAYVTTCVPAEVTKADHANCTEEIPVNHNGTTKFVDPFTFVMRDFPTEMPCSDLMPIRWRVQGTWFCSHPSAVACTAPGQLETFSTPYRPTGDITQGLGKDAYSEKQRQQHREFRRAFVGRQAINAKMASQSVRNSRGQGRLGLPLSKEDVEDLKWNIVAFLFPWIPIVGEAWNWFAGLLLFGLVVKLLVGGLIRMYVLYVERGCGVWILGALWNTLFTIIRAPPAMFTAAYKTAMAGQQEDIPMTSCYKRYANYRSSPGGRGRGVYEPDDSPKGPQGAPPPEEGPGAGRYPKLRPEDEGTPMMSSFGEAAGHGLDADTASAGTQTAAKTQEKGEKSKK
jgi:hypothetical protein